MLVYPHSPSDSVSRFLFCNFILFLAKRKVKKKLVKRDKMSCVLGSAGEEAAYTSFLLQKESLKGGKGFLFLI